MRETKPSYKRKNRTTGLGEAVGTAIDGVFRKRGFASRDIVTNWGAIAPAPYDKLTIPDKLAWPRGEAGAEGAILYLRCAEAYRHALAHEGDVIAAAVNRYFGYVLVGGVRLSAMPFTPGSGPKDDTVIVPSEGVRTKVENALEGIEDDGIKSALRKLGHNLMSKKK